MSDLAPPEIGLWQAVEAEARAIFPRYGYEEIRTPSLEYTALFTRSIGDTTDVVQKEMYTFEDPGGRSLTLRPEGTAGVVRYLAGLGPEAAGRRLYYIGPMFRRERPQAGRKRQFHQLGAEALDPPCPAADVECIALQTHLLSAWGVRDATVEINTRGTPEDRAAVAKGLRDALEPRRKALCDDCNRRFDANVLRVLDCKQPTCQEAAAFLPPVTSFMAESSRAYLDEVCRLLDRLEMPYRLNPRLVRGLDYYVHTVWEITHDALGAQNTLSGGGRYRIELGGRALEGVGFAMGLERLMTALQAADIRPPEPDKPVWLVPLGDRARAVLFELAQTLRFRGVACGMALAGGSLKAQMRAANRAEASTAVLCGDRELDNGVFLLKNMTDGAQEELDLPALMQRLCG